MTGSAKRSIFPRKAKNGLLRFAPRNDNKYKHAFAISRRECARAVHEISAPSRAWGMPDAQCTRGLVCNDSGRTHTSNNEYTESHGIPARNGFNGFLRALPGDRALLPPSSAD